MGSVLTARRNTGVETVDIAASNAYKYPPKTGQYFGTHFIMGGERFDSPQPGEYLFGDNDDLNFLGNKPIPFPYPVPSGNEPTKTLKSLVYVRKDSVRLVKSLMSEKVPLDKEEATVQYNLEFTFDSDCRCAITIYYFATEEISGGQIVYHPKDPRLCSETYHYKKGAGQVFTQSSHLIDPSRFADEEWQMGAEKDVIPVVIHCTVEEEEHPGHSHVTFATLEKGSDGHYAIKPLKQKQFVDGLCYLLQEIYGIENKNMERSKLDPDDEMEDSGAECVICMSDMRDTLILPCRHLCLCSACAESLRYQASMCPICRVKFRALLQIRAMRKKAPPSTLQPGEINEENTVSQEGVPSGYEAVTLIEALNGQCVPPMGEGGPTLPVVTPANTVFTLENTKKNQKGSQITSMTPIEYQKEMDPDKEVSDANEKQVAPVKKDGEEEVSKGRSTPEVVLSEQVSDKKKETSPKKPKLPEVRYFPAGKTVEMPVSEPAKDYPIKEDSKPLPRKPPPSYEEIQKNDATKSDRYAMDNLLNEEKLEVEVKGQLTSGLSTGDMADDEHEDSSDAEPEPDYEEDEENTRNEHRGVLMYCAQEGVQEGEERYHPLHVTDHIPLPDTPGSSTEASSYGSNSSSQALLNVEPAEEDRTTV